MVAAVMAFGSNAIADDVAPLLGKWTGQYKTEEGIEREAEVVFRMEGSTWTARPKGSAGRNNPCFGRPFPLVIDADSPTEYVVFVKAGRVVPGCKGSTADLTLVAPDRLEGRLRNGGPVTLHRQPSP